MKMITISNLRKRNHHISFIIIIHIQLVKSNPSKQILITSTQLDIRKQSQINVTFTIKINKAIIQVTINQRKTTLKAVSITNNNKQLNNSCINNNTKPTNINYSIPTMQSSNKHLYNSTAVDIKGEHITFNPQDFLSKNMCNSTHQNTYNKHIINTTTNLPINTLQ